MSKRDPHRRKEKIRKLKAQSLRHRAAVTSGTAVNVTSGNLAQAMTTAVDLHRNGKVSEARSLYRKVLALQPDHSDALSSLAMIELDRHPDRALQLLQRAIATVPDNPGYYMNLGYVMDGLGRSTDAIAAYQQAIDIMPGYRDPYYNLGDLYLKLDQPEAAIEVFDQCIASNGRDFHALAYKAHALRDAGDFVNAGRLLDYDTFVKRYEMPVPDCFEDLEQMNLALAKHVSRHPSLQANVRSTVKGDHTAELLAAPWGPMAEMETVINRAVGWYCSQLPDMPDHPVIQSRPVAWRLTAWGVVLKNKGHERSHIHPNGWLSGVFYVQLPDVVSNPASAPQGWLEFGRPTTDLRMRAAPETRTYQPQYGSIILFPSYFYPGTVPFTSKEKRICISFDAEPTVEQQRGRSKVPE